MCLSGTPPWLQLTKAGVGVAGAAGLMACVAHAEDKRRSPTPHAATRFTVISSSSPAGRGRVVPTVAAVPLYYTKFIPRSPRERENPCRAPENSVQSVLRT